MIDLSFVHAVEAALAEAVSGVLKDRPSRPSDSNSPHDMPVRSVCKQAAQRLYFELDGQALLDLALMKLSAEQYPAVCVINRDPGMIAL